MYLSDWKYWYKTMTTPSEKVVEMDYRSLSIYIEAKGVARSGRGNSH